MVEEASERRQRWDMDSTRLLLRYREQILLETSVKQPHRLASMTGAMWNDVSRRLLEHKIEKTGLQCSQKYTNLKTLYQQMKDESKKSGAGGPNEKGSPPRQLSRELFELMDNQFRKCESVNPPFLIHLGKPKSIPLVVTDSSSSATRVESSPEKRSGDKQVLRDGYDSGRSVPVRKKGRRAAITEKLENVAGSIALLMDFMKQQEEKEMEERKKQETRECEHDKQWIGLMSSLVERIGRSGPP